LLNFRKNYPTSKLFDSATYALGLAYFQKQDYESSRQIFGKFNEFKDGSLKQQAIYLLGTSLFNLGKFEDAIEVFKNLIRLYGQDKQLAQKAEYEIADCYFQMGNESEAMNRFKALRSKYPESSLTSEIIWWLGEYYYRHNDFRLARRYFLSLVQDFPKSNLVADAYYAIGSSFKEEGRNEAALENFKQVLKSGKSDLAAQAAVAIADIYVAEGNPNLAGLAYPKMADIYFRNSNYTEALDYFRKSVDLVPVYQAPEIQFKIAETLEAQGKLDQAIEEYFKVAYLPQDNNTQMIKALFRIAQIYEGRKKLIEAVNVYKKIVSMNVEESKFAEERISLINRQVQ
jgi:TolA-binding protein